jgi:hypothetical protein
MARGEPSGFNPNAETLCLQQAMMGMRHYTCSSHNA